MKRNKFENDTHKKYSKKKHNKRKKKLLIKDIDLKENRIIIIDEEIDDAKAKEVVELLLKMDIANNKKDITMYINCPGGVVSAGFMIYDIMQTIKSPVKTVCVGRAASFGTILLLGGKPGFRYIGRNAEVMIHSVSGMNYGDVHTLKEKVDHTLRLNSRIIKLISEKTKLSYKQVKFYTKKQDKYFSADEALKFGFVDKIL